MFQFKTAPTIATDKTQADSYDEFEERLHGEEFSIMRNLIVDSLSQDTDMEMRVLDCGTGTGDIALRVLKKYPKATVVGIDASEAYLSVFKRKIQQEKLANRVSVKQVDLHNGVPTDLGIFDFVVSQYVFHYRFDRIALFKSIYKVLRPGGKLIFGVAIPQDSFAENAKYWLQKEKNSRNWHLNHGCGEQEASIKGKEDVTSLHSYCRTHGNDDRYYIWISDLNEAGFVNCKYIWRKSMDTVIEAIKPSL